MARASELAKRIYQLEWNQIDVIDKELNEVRYVLQGLQTSTIDTGEAVESHWCNPAGVNCNNVCERTRALMAQLEVK